MAAKPEPASRIKQFAILHCEKLAFILIGLVAVVLACKSLTLPQLDDEYQANKLQHEITQTRNEIEGFSWHEALTDHPDKICKSTTIALKSTSPISAQAYVNSGNGTDKSLFAGFDRTVIAPMAARTDPLLLGALDVRVSGGTGLFAFEDDEVRKQRQLRMATEAAEMARKEAQNADLERYSQQTGQGAGFASRRGRSGGPRTDPSDRPYDPEHPRRRAIDGSLYRAGVSLEGDERVERVFWACVVAKVPVREQLKLYQDSFENARGYDPRRDVPQYLGFFVERAEVRAGKESQWLPVPLYDGQQQSIASKSSLSVGPKGVLRGRSTSF